MTDINGFKKPNKIGKDIYAFWITENKIIPVGSNDTQVNLCENYIGWGCSAKYLGQ